jgi:hypothetical protein
MNSSGHPFGPGPTATIREDSPRADAWRTIFGGLTAPIKTAVPQRCEIARTVSLVYWLDIGRIDSAMMDRLVAHAQSQIAGVVPHEQVRLVLVAEGMPIKCEDVSTITDEHPEGIIAGLNAEIAKATRYQRETSEYDRKFAVDNNIITARVPNLRTVPSKPFRIAIVEADIPHEISDERPSDDASMSIYVPKDKPSDATHHAALDAVFKDIADRIDAQAGVPLGMLRANDATPRATYDIPPGASIGDTTINPDRMTAQQIAEMIGGEVINEQTIRSPSLAIQSAQSHIIFDRHDIRSELSSGDGLPPALCQCLTDGTPRGPHCVHAREWPFRGDDGVRRVRKHGGVPTCPRACVECSDGAHHFCFCEIDMQPMLPLDMSDDALDDDEREEIAALRQHPAHLAGCESWYECRHCDGWLEASDNDDLDEDAPPDSDDAPDSDDCDDEDDDSFEDDDDDWDDESDDNEPDSSPTRSLHPVNDSQIDLFATPAPPVAVPAWASELAHRILFFGRFIKIVGMNVPNNVTVQWSAVIATWSNDVQTRVHEWLVSADAPLNVPDAVQALVEQANGCGV